MANFPTSLPSSTPATHGEVVGEVVAMATTLRMLPNRNRIINGNFRTNQRGYVSGTSTATGAYMHDRWKVTSGATNYTFTADPHGQTVTLGTSPSIAQIVERANIEAGTYVLSWVGTATGRVYNVGGTAPGYAASPVTVTLDGLADVTVEFTTTSGTLGKVQLEIGTQPTPFEVIPVGQELALCQRYFQRLGGTLVPLGTGVGTGTGTADCFTPLLTTMRATPTLTFGAAGSFTALGSASITVTAISTNLASPQELLLNISAAGAFTNGGGFILYGNTTTGTIDAGAEL